MGPQALKLDGAEMQCSWLVRKVQQELTAPLRVQPSSGARHGHSVRGGLVPNPVVSSILATEALRGVVEFKALPTVDGLKRDRRTDPRDGRWNDGRSGLLWVFLSIFPAYWA